MYSPTDSKIIVRCVQTHAVALLFVRQLCTYFALGVKRQLPAGDGIAIMSAASCRQGVGESLHWPRMTGSAFLLRKKHSDAALAPGLWCFHLEST